MGTNRCELLARAKALAIKRGLDDTKVECPFVDSPVCTGTHCILYEAPHLAGKGYEEKSDNERLTELRDELKKLG
jgi:hypothetical protein